MRSEPPNILLDPLVYIDLESPPLRALHRHAKGRRCSLCDQYQQSFAVSIYDVSRAPFARGEQEDAAELALWLQAQQPLEVVWGPSPLSAFQHAQLLCRVRGWTHWGEHLFPPIQIPSQGEYHPARLISRALLSLRACLDDPAGGEAGIGEAIALLGRAEQAVPLAGLVLMSPYCIYPAFDMSVPSASRQGEVRHTLLGATIEIERDLSTTENQRRLGEALCALRNGRLAGHAVSLLLVDHFSPVEIPYFHSSADGVAPPAPPMHGVLRYPLMGVVVDGAFDSERLPSLYRLTRYARLKVSFWWWHCGGAGELAPLPPPYRYDEEARKWELVLVEPPADEAGQ